jgi:hypothetical protein
MARPTKTGLDYFPLDVDMDQDDKLFFIEAKYGLISFAIIVRILMLIYKDGYYKYYSEDKEAFMLAKRLSVDVNVLRNVINDCINEGIFNKNLFEQYGILTSRGIQKRYLEACGRRKEVIIIKEYCLVNTKKYKNIVFEHLNRVNVDNNPDKCDIMQTETPQSKVKKSKVKKSNNNICAPDSAHVHTASQPGGSVEAEKVTATLEDKPSKSGPRSPFKSKRQEQLFDEFWAQYPKKRSKGRAERAWVKIKPDEQLFKAILDGLERAKTSGEWQKDSGQYIPYPATWLNAKGWEDEYSEEGDKGERGQHTGENQSEFNAIDFSEFEFEAGVPKVP